MFKTIYFKYLLKQRFNYSIAFFKGAQLFDSLDDFNLFGSFISQQTLIYRIGQGRQLKFVALCKYEVSKQKVVEFTNFARISALARGAFGRVLTC